MSKEADDILEMGGLSCHVHKQDGFVVHWHRMHRPNLKEGSSSLGHDRWASLLFVCFFSGKPPNKRGDGRGTPPFFSIT